MDSLVGEREKRGRRRGFRKQVLEMLTTGVAKKERKEEIRRLAGNVSSYGNAKSRILSHDERQ